jgi:hypothetical protein
VRDPTACLPGYRFPMIVIQEVVYLRFRFNLSLRDIPDLMARKGGGRGRSDQPMALGPFLSVNPFDSPMGLIIFVAL